MPAPVRQVLSWAACAVAPSARVVSAREMRAGGNPWLLRLADAGPRRFRPIEIRSHIGGSRATAAASDHAAPSQRSAVMRGLTGGSARKRWTASRGCECAVSSSSARHCLREASAGSYGHGCHGRS